MSPSRKFQELKVWQESHKFVLMVYKHSKAFPKEELYGLTSQFRRAAVSIAANIAEGYGKMTKPDKLRFFNISQGSIDECQYYIILSKDLEYINNEACLKMEEKLEDVSKMLNSYYRAIKADM